MQVNWKNNIDVTIFRHGAIVIFYDVAVFPLLNLSYSSNMIFGPVVMTIFVYKVLTRNPKIGNTPVWVLPNISRLGKLRMPNYARISRMKSYWMLQNLSFYIFWFIKGKNRGWGGGSKNTPTQIRITAFFPVTYRSFTRL